MDNETTERLLAEVLRLRNEVDTLRGLLQAKGILRPEEWPVATAQVTDESGTTSMRELVDLGEERHDPDAAPKSDAGSTSWLHSPPSALGSSGRARSHRRRPASPPGDAGRMPDRENTARANLRRALDEAGLRDVGFELTRGVEGYRVLLRRGAARWRRIGIDEATLEDEDSPRLTALIREAKGRLHG